MTCGGDNWGLFFAAVAVSVLLWNVWKTSHWYKPPGSSNG